MNTIIDLISNFVRGLNGVNQFLFLIGLLTIVGGAIWVVYVNFDEIGEDLKTAESYTISIEREGVRSLRGDSTPEKDIENKEPTYLKIENVQLTPTKFDEIMHYLYFEVRVRNKNDIPDLQIEVDFDSTIPRESESRQLGSRKNCEDFIEDKSESLHIYRCWELGHGDKVLEFLYLLNQPKFDKILVKTIDKQSEDKLSDIFSFDENYKNRAQEGFGKKSKRRKLRIEDVQLTPERFNNISNYLYFKVNADKSSAYGELNINVELGKTKLVDKAFRSEGINCAFPEDESVYEYVVDYVVWVYKSVVELFGGEPPYAQELVCKYGLGKNKEVEVLFLLNKNKFEKIEIFESNALSGSTSEKLTYSHEDYNEHRSSRKKERNIEIEIEENKDRQIIKLEEDNNILKQVYAKLEQDYDVLKESNETVLKDNNILEEQVKKLIHEISENGTPKSELNELRETVLNDNNLPEEQVAEIKKSSKTVLYEKNNNVEYGFTRPHVWSSIEFLIVIVSVSLVIVSVVLVGILFLGMLVVFQLRSRKD